MALPDETSLEQEPAPAGPSVSPKRQKLVAAKPGPNRVERLIFTTYFAVIALIVAFLAVTGLVALLAA